MHCVWFSYLRKTSFNSSFLFVQQKFPVIYESFRCFSELNTMKVLNVAEKNDAAKNISAFLSRCGARKREGPSKFNKIYEFECEAFNQKCAMVMTSVSGHVLDLEFSNVCKNWNLIQPSQLFEERVYKCCLPKNLPIKENLQMLARTCNVLIIWTDCDREGENIGFQIIDICKEVRPNLKIYRAKFSEITQASVQKALRNLEMPNEFLSKAVDVRKELDLKIGAAFTRFQTLFFRRAFPQNLQIVSYGTCQFPTLGFVIDRFKSIAEFIPELFWEINVQHKTDNEKVNFEWKRHRLFDKLACQVLYEKCIESSFAKVESVDSKPKAKWRPKPLNTIDFEKLASKILKINAKKALDIAEKLYSRGIISYPRTETTIFPKELKLGPLVESQTEDPNWGEFARKVLQAGPNPFQGNKSDQAHPPIHPIKYTNALSGNEKSIYELIVRHFLACLSKHAEGLETTVEITVGEEKFTAKGLVVTAKNYLEVYPYEKWSDKIIPIYNPGDTFKPDISLKEGETSPPELLTESDLLSLMEKNGIGTDATQAEHIDKIKSRMYVGLKQNKYFVPRTLGMALVESYHNLGYLVAKPKFRADLEADLLRISRNEISTEEVLSRHISVHREIYQGLQSQLVGFFNTLVTYLYDEEKGCIKPLEQQTIQAVRKCTHCGSPMILKKTKSNLYEVGCSNFPQCQESISFPQGVTHVSPTNTVCSECGPDNYLLEFTFRSENTQVPDKYVGCAGGCDETLLNYLKECSGARRLPNRSNTSNSTSSNDSGICTSSENLPERVCNDLSIPNCFCGVPAIRLKVKKPGPNINRYFYKCEKSSNSCNFFHWADESVGSAQFNNVKRQLNTAEEDRNEEVRCYCAVTCRRNMVRKEGANKGREFYCCGKPRGSNDECNFFKWVDGENSSSNQATTVTQNLYYKDRNYKQFNKNNTNGWRTRN